MKSARTLQEFCCYSDYFRAKIAQAESDQSLAGPIHDRSDYAIFRVCGEHRPRGQPMGRQTVRLPSALMQPDVSDDAAAVMAKVAVKEPLNRTIELADPEPIRLEVLVRRFLRANRDARMATTDAPRRLLPHAGE